VWGDGRLKSGTPTHEHRAAWLIEVRLQQRERFADPRACTARHHDQPVQPQPIRTITRGAHDGDDLLDCRRIWGQRNPLLRGGRLV
jgi:hypothetical protein